MNDCTISIRPTGVGRYSNEWVDALVRMYRLCAERHGYSVTVVCSAGEQQMQLSGNKVYNLFRDETGVHTAIKCKQRDTTSRYNLSANVLVEYQPEIFSFHEVWEKGLIRSYEMTPSCLVRDYQTSTETMNLKAVLDGHIDAFLVLPKVATKPVQMFRTCDPQVPK